MCFVIVSNANRNFVVSPASIFTAAIFAFLAFLFT